MSRVGSTGGWLYHLRALRYGSQEWRGHLEAVHRFLDDWYENQRFPRQKTLILIGPSAGYSLPGEFLNRYDQVIAYEPDSLARWLFERKFSGLKARLEWKTEGYDFRSPLPEGAVLFCNLLGQIDLSDLRPFQSRFFEIVKGRSWASYHDAFSGEGIRFPEPAKKSAGIQTRSTRPVEVTEHVAPDLFKDRPGLKPVYWEWRLTRNRTHLIEGVFHGE